MLSFSFKWSLSLFSASFRHCHAYHATASASHLRRLECWVGTCLSVVMMQRLLQSPHIEARSARRGKRAMTLSPPLSHYHSLSLSTYNNNEIITWTTASKSVWEGDMSYQTIVCLELRPAVCSNYRAHIQLKAVAETSSIMRIIPIYSAVHATRDSWSSWRHWLTVSRGRYSNLWKY